MFGAPLMDDGLVNSRRDFSMTEPTVEYNAGAVAAFAAMADWYASPAYTGANSLEGVTAPACSKALQGVALAPAPAPAALLAPPPAAAPGAAPAGGGGAAPAAAVVKPASAAWRAPALAAAAAAAAAALLA
jgi:hypothetical protein